MYKISSFVSLLITLTTGNLIFSQQKIMPGGVAEPYYWIKSANNGDSFYWKNGSPNKVALSERSQKGELFNFNPSIVFDKTQDSLLLPLGTESKRRQTVFMVYKVKDSLKEQFLWNITDPKKTLSVATNKRLADLKKYSYQAYKEKIKPQKANIHFFQQNITDSVPKPATLSIGLKSKFENLPPSEFDGNISEILVYNRVLSANECQKTASYLAIKYGITLSQFDTKNYLNSQGEIIWDADKHKGFDNSITGVGRDDASGLQQPKSSNMLNEGLLTIGLKSKSGIIPNNHFAFWSDNGKNLLVKKQEQGEPVGISRQWQLDFTNPGDLSIDWAFDPAFIKDALAKDSYYWLLVDYSGKGTFDINDSEYICLGSTSSKEKLTLTDFNWDKQKTGKTKFTIKIAPKMFSRVQVTQAKCGVLNSGELQYAIEGGEAPYSITVKKEGTGTVVKQWNQTAKNSAVVPLSSGTYDYIVRDAKGNLYSETIFVADKEGTVPNLKPEYQLTSETPLILDASAGLTSGNYSYQWYYEGDFIDNNPKIIADQEGAYELRLMNGQDCKTATKIAVTSDGTKTSNPVVQILYPNPTADGHFTIAMDYPHQTNATITVYTPSGALVQQKELTQITTYLYDDVIKGSAGLYLVTVNSEFGNKTFKVIVK